MDTRFVMGKISFFCTFKLFKVVYILKDHSEHTHFPSLLPTRGTKYIFQPIADQPVLNRELYAFQRNIFYLFHN